MKPFDLEQAKAGKKVCTRDGLEVEILKFDVRNKFPILALVNEEEGEQEICSYTNEGLYNYKAGIETGLDLRMVEEKKEGWVNVLEQISDNKLAVDYVIYGSESEAIGDFNKYRTGRFQNFELIDTVKIQWEE